MQGDAELGQQLQKILARFDFDWEELIARVVGDTPARKIGNGLRFSAQWVEQTANQSKENLAGYLQEEKRILVTEVAMAQFTSDVAALRADVDRISQRIDRVRHSIAAD